MSGDSAAGVGLSLLGRIEAKRSGKRIVSSFCFLCFMHFCELHATADSDVSTSCYRLVLGCVD